jgi:hypothetical protein
VTPADRVDVATEMLVDLLRLRLRSVELLNMLGDRTGLAIAAGEPLVADFERLRGADHPDTLSTRNNLATAYQGGGADSRGHPAARADARRPWEAVGR